MVLGLGQWRLQSDDEAKCWVCNHTNNVLILWNTELSNSESRQLTGERHQNVVAQLRMINTPNELETKKPLFYCQSQNWRPSELKTLTQFCYSLEKEEPDFLDILKIKRQIREQVESVDQMTEKELAHYNQFVVEYKAEKYGSSHGVKKCLIESLIYRNPQLVNAEGILNLDKLNEGAPLYAIPVFMKPGKQLYVVSLPQEDGSVQYYSNQVIIKKRDEDPPVFAKTMKSNLVARQFKKESSVWKDWREDTPQQIADAMEHDLKLWNITRLIKSEEERAAVENVVRQYGQVLKNVFIQAASRGSFPYCGWQDFAMFCQRANIPDKKGAPMSTIDRAFIAVEKGGDESIGGYQPKSMMRFQFIEGLLRIADAKYREVGTVQNQSEAFEMLIKECIIEQYEWRPWQEFRNEQLYTLEVTDILSANMSGINKLINVYKEPNKFGFKMADCLRLFTKDTDSGITEKDFYYCYGMSKMTNAKESEHHKNYSNVQLVEFLEVICRAADVRYAELAGISLSEKIEYMLDELFKLVGTKRNDVNVEVEEQSVSDDEY